MRRFVFAAFALTVLAACQPVATEMTEEQKAEIAETIQQMNTELAVAMNARDLDSWLSGLSDDIRWAIPYGYGSHSQIEDAVRSAPTDTTEWGMDWEETFVRVLGPDAAVLWGTYAARGTEGERVHTTLVYAHVDGEWKVVHGHSTDAEQPPETP